MPKSSLCLVAFDLGAESGRVVLGRFDGQTLRLEEVHRFANEPVRACGRLYWDLLRLLLEIKRGLSAAWQASGAGLHAMAIDTWGVDFALFADNGELIANPYHYRDAHTEGVMADFFAILPARAVFEITGIQIMPINTLFQLFAMQRARSPFLRVARRFLMLPSAFAYLLSGVEVDEFTAASTSQLLDPRTGTWSPTILSALGLPATLFADVVPAGTVAGNLRRDVAEDAGVGQFPVILAGGHDTACAVAAVPATETGGWAYISSGTWSLVGVQLRQPLITDKTFEANLSNEGGVLGTLCLHKNVMGLWLLQQCRRQWSREKGGPVDYEALVALARQAPSRRSFVDPDAPVFLRPGDTVGDIRRFCANTGQPVPEEPGEIVRTILESLALKYRWVIERLESVTGTAIDRIHMVGGGSRNELLCQLTANVTGRPVVAGPVEATSIGNLLMQATALGELRSLEELREVVRRSFTTRTYEPIRHASWDDAYDFFCNRVLVPELGPS